MLLIDGVPAPDALARDRGLAYGDGVFETIALRHGRPLCRDLHLARLQHGCRALGFAPPAASTLSADCQLLAEQREHGVIKIIVTRGDGGRGYRPPPVVRPRRIASLHPWPSDLDPGATTGVKTWICRHRLSVNTATAGLKHLNRLDQVLASQEWPSDDFFEGLMLDTEDNLIEGTRSNLFVVKAGTLYTPDLHSSGVAGIVRRLLIESCRREGTALVIGTLDPATLAAVDEIFICNSIIGLRAVTYVRAAATIELEAGPVTASLRRRLQRQGCIP